MSKPGKIIPFPGRHLGGPPAPPAAEPTSPAPVAPRDRSLVEVLRCTPGEALVLKGLFESQGIPAVFRARTTASVYPFTVGTQGEVVVLVPQTEGPRSRRLLVRVARRAAR